MHRITGKGGEDSLIEMSPTDSYNGEWANFPVLPRALSFFLIASKSLLLSFKQVQSHGGKSLRGLSLL